MKCLDNCHTYKMDTFLKTQLPGLYDYLGQHPWDILPIIHFYEMHDDGTKIDGVTNEEVIKVLIHRLEFLNKEWQHGKYNCLENLLAISHLKEALVWLNKRTEDRAGRGVEGKMEV